MGFLGEKAHIQMNMTYLEDKTSAVDPSIMIYIDR